MCYLPAKHKLKLLRATLLRSLQEQSATATLLTSAQLCVVTDLVSITLLSSEISKMAPQHALIQPWKVTDPWPSRASDQAEEGKTSPSQPLCNLQDELRVSEVLASTVPGFVRSIINKTVRYAVFPPLRNLKQLLNGF